MRLLILSMLVMSISISKVAAQETEFYPLEKMLTFDDQSATAWTVVIGEDMNDIKKSFTKYVKSKYDIKAKASGKNQLVAKQVRIPAISDKEGDLWASFFNEYGKVQMGLTFFVGYSIPVNRDEYPEEMNNLRKVAQDFALHYNKMYYNNMLSDTNKRLKKLSSELKSGEKEISSLNKQIKRIDKDLQSVEDENKKFDLTNKNVENRARLKAVADVVHNLKAEIARVSLTAEDTKVSLQKLESFAVID